MNQQTLDIATPEPEEILWLRGTYLPSIGGNKARASRELGISHKVLNGLLNGSYQGNTNRQLAKLREQQARLTAAVQAAPGVDLESIPTALMRRIFRAAEAAKIAGICLMVSGKSQIGKSTAARAIKKRWPDTTILFEMPEPANTASVMDELLRACGQSMAGSTWRKFCAARDYFSRRHLIIVDEAHTALESPAGIRSLELLRKLHNATGAAMLFIFTPVAAEKMLHGPNAERLLQLDRRGEWEVLPECPSAKDIRAIWEAYGLPEPDADTQKQIGAMVRATCFGQYIHRLKLAVGAARLEQRAWSWADFVEATRRMDRRPA